MIWFRRIVTWVAIAAALFLVVMTVLSRRSGAGKNEYTVTIDRPPAQVFPWLIEPYRLTRWIDGLESSTPFPGDSAVRGGRSRDVILVGGSRYTLVTQIADIRRDTLLAVHIESEPKGFVVDARYELSPTGRGTRLRYTGHADFAGMFARVMEPLVTPQSQKKVEADMKRLKQLIEAHPGSGGI